MGSPASPVIADIVMEELLDVSINMMSTKPKILTKYVDDLFGIIKKKDVENTQQILNSYNRQIKLTMEDEKDNKLAYLDALIIRHGNLLRTDWYQKSTSSGRLINFHSKHPRRTIINTATNFIKRVLTISDKEFHKTNRDKIRKILTMNDFPKRTIEDLLRRSRIPKNIDKEQETTTPTIYKTMTFIPGFSERLQNSNIYDKNVVKVAHKTQNTTNLLFSKTKSKVIKDDKSNLVYKIQCKGDGSEICQKVYVGTTKTKLKTRLSSHKSDLKAFDKPIENKTALAAHCALTGHKPNFDNVEILAEESNYHRRYTLEMLHIIDVPTEKRLNYKSDTDRCSQMYRHTVKKHGRHKHQSTART